MRTTPRDRQDRMLLAVLLGLHAALLIALPVAAWSMAAYLRRTGSGGGEKWVILSLIAALALLAEIGLARRALRVLDRLRGAPVPAGADSKASGSSARGGPEAPDNGAEPPVD